MYSRLVTVSGHAVNQLQRRRPAEYGVLTKTQVARTIRREVQSALEQGRISSTKPVGFRLHREKKAGPLPEGQRIVWSLSGELGWIIAREAGHDAVITTLTRATAAE